MVTQSEQQQQQQNGNVSDMERKASVESTVRIIEKQNESVAGPIATDILTTDPKSDKQKTLSWFLKRKIFLQMICGTESSSKIFLIGLLFAVLSGCSVSIVVVFLGRIKHILLRSNSQTELFLKRIYEQIIILMLVVVLAAATHFGMHLSSTVLKERIRSCLKQRYEGMHRHKYLNEEIIAKVIQNVDLVEKGWETFGMQCRNVAIIISSLIICYYHDSHLTLITLSIVPIGTTFCIFSKRLSMQSDVILSGKICQMVQIEKGLLLQKNCIGNIENDEYLLRLSAEVRSFTRHAILHEVWKSFQSGILSFIILTFIGCGMLYGGYLLDANSMVKEGDIFIIVLSMALVVDSISTTVTDFCIIEKGVHAALYIRSLQQFHYRFMLTRYCNQRCLLDEITVTLITAPEFMKSIGSSRGNSIIRFINGTRSVLDNNHNHKLFLFVGFTLTIIRGLEQPACSVVMGEIFSAMRGNTQNFHLLALCATQLSAIGFTVLISSSLSTLLIAVASEYMSVSFHVILSRYLLKMTDKESSSRSKINTLIDENIALTSEAKALYQSYLPELMIRMTSLTTNIILGFLYSWQIALLGLIFTLSCLFVQLELEFEVFTSCYNYIGCERLQKKSKVLQLYKHSFFRAINFSIVQTFGFVIKVICYSLAALICYYEYKYQAQAFTSVITLFAASQQMVQLPYLIRKICKSWRSVHRIFACMNNKSCRSCTPSISKSIKFEC